MSEAKGHSFLCFARGAEDGWESVCVDLDISVQGDSFEEVKSLLNEAVRSYVADAMKESPADCERLLRRSAPWYVTLGMTLQVIWFNLLHRHRNDGRASFPVACHA